MSLEVGLNNNQTKRANPEYTLESKQGAVSLANEKSYTRQQAADTQGISLSLIDYWSKAGCATAASAKAVAMNAVGI